MLAYVVGSFAQTVCEHLEWQVHVFHRKFGTQQLLCVQSSFRFHCYSMCIPLPLEF